MITKTKSVKITIAQRNIRSVEATLGIFLFSRKFTTGFKRYDSSAAIKKGKIILPRKYIIKIKKREIIKGIIYLLFNPFDVFFLI
jgi:hypothetical protein